MSNSSESFPIRKPLPFLVEGREGAVWDLGESRANRFTIVALGSPGARRRVKVVYSINCEEYVCESHEIEISSGDFEYLTVLLHSLFGKV